MTHEEIKKVKLETLWWVIDHFQEARIEDEGIEDREEWNDVMLSYNDVEVELYNIMKMIDSREGDWIPVKERYPDKEGEYEVKMHTGSIKPRIREMKAKFNTKKGLRHGFTGEGDWNYVTHWKPVRII